MKLVFAVRWRVFAVFLLLFKCLLLGLSLTNGEQTAFADPFREPLSELKKIEPANVVRFRVLERTENADQETHTLLLETRGGFKIYDHGLRVEARAFSGAVFPLSFRSDPAPRMEYDPWYEEDRETHSAGSRFLISSNTRLTEQDVIRIRFESCSVSACLLPVWFEIVPVVGQVSVQAERAKRGEFELPGDKPKQQMSSQSAQSLNGSSAGLDLGLGDPGALTDLGGIPPPDPKALSSAGEAPAVDAKVEQPARMDEVAAEDNLSLLDRVTVFVQKALTGRSVWLFPALFLAGLLMNLTPCVYPMIPITLNVLGRLGHTPGELEEEHFFDGVLRALLYVSGIVVTYSLMGVVAGMTGTIFGSLLQSPAVLVSLAVLFVVLGFAMLGVLDLSRVQVWASKIPISEKSPHLGVFTMGAVSGLVSAPCTGPVLSAILLLIGQSQDPVYGLALMAFFSLGFGAPYLVLGLFAHNLRRLPRAGRMLDLVKNVFAALLFGLSLYYLKPVLTYEGGFLWLYSEPAPLLVALVAVMALTFSMAAKMFEQVKVLARAAVVACLTALSFWLCLFVVKGFSEPSRVTDAASGETKPVGVQWVSDWRQGVQLARTSGRGLLVDAWAEWCAACIKMDKELWNQAEVAAKVEASFVGVKLDFTRSSAFTDELAERWDISGLPAVALFAADSDFEGQPTKLFRQEVKKAELFSAIDEVAP